MHMVLHRFSAEIFRRYIKFAVILSPTQHQEISVRNNHPAAHSADYLHLIS